MSAVARYLKGCKMLERYEGKLSRTVLRRGEASNRLFLVYIFVVFVIKSAPRDHEWQRMTRIARMFDYVHTTIKSECFH